MSISFYGYFLSTLLCHNALQMSWYRIVVCYFIDEFFETGVSLTNTVAVENATSRVSSRIAYTNTVLTGYMPNSKLTKNIVNASVRASSPNRYLTTEVNFTFLNQRAKGRSETGYGDNNVMQKFVQWGHRELNMK